MMTYDASESLNLGRHAAALIAAAGVDLADVMSLEIVLPNHLVVTAVIRSPDGAKLEAGGDVQRVVKHLRIDWP